MKHLPLRVPGDPWLYAFARVLLVTAVGLYGRFRVSGAANLPARGAAIVVANHPSDVDPILLGVALPRTLHFMADVVQFRRGFVGPVITRLAAFPVRKGSVDTQALREALGLLARGEVVTLFPEGDLVRQSNVSSFNRGVALLAARSGAPVVPAAIVGAERIWMGGRIHRPFIEVRVGAPIEFDGLPHNAAAYSTMTEKRACGRRAASRRRRRHLKATGPRASTPGRSQLRQAVPALICGVRRTAGLLHATRQDRYTRCHSTVITVPRPSSVTMSSCAPACCARSRMDLRPM